MGVRNTTAVEAKTFSAMTSPALMLTIIILAAGCATGLNAGKSVYAVQPVHQAALPEIPENGYTWQNLVDLVISTSPDYAAILAQANAEYYSYRAKTTPKELQFSLEGSYLPYEKRINQYSAGVSFSIPNPFVNRQIIKTGEAARREMETGAQALEKKITSAIYVLVREILIGEQELEILSLREQVLSDWAELLKMRYDLRVATQADIHEFDIQRLRLKAVIQQTQSGIHAARRSLRVLVQIPDERLILDSKPIDWKAVLAELDDEEKIIAGALSRSVELAGANAAYEKAGAILGAARAKQIPWFDSVYLSYDPSFTESLNNIGGNLVYTRNRTDKWTLGININLPVFTWFGSEKKMGAAGTEAASLRIAGISQQIRNDITETITELREAINFLIEYQTGYNSIYEPVRETMPDAESYFKLMDAWLSASVYALEFELECVEIYGKFLRITGAWELGLH